MIKWISLFLVLLSLSAIRCGKKNPAEPERIPKEYFLSAQGDDSNSGSKDAPWDSFDYAIGKLQAGDILKEGVGFLHRQGQDLGDVLAFVGDLQGLTIIALAMAVFALHVDIRQEMHLDLAYTVALTALAASTFHIEGEPAGLVAPQLGFRQGCEKVSDKSECAGIGGGV